MPKKKAIAKKVVSKTASKQYFSTKINFIILILFCILVASVFNTLYRGF